MVGNVYSFSVFVLFHTSSSSVPYRKIRQRGVIFQVEMGLSIGISKYRLKFMVSVSVSVFFNRYLTDIL